MTSRRKLLALAGAGATGVVAAGVAVLSDSSRTESASGGGSDGGTGPGTGGGGRGTTGETGATGGTRGTETDSPADDWRSFAADAGNTAHLPARGPGTKASGRWSFGADGGFRTGPAVVAGGSAGDTVYVADERLVVYAVDARNGRSRWRYSLDYPVRGTVAVAGETAYVATVNGHVDALSVADGSVEWTHEESGQARGSPTATGRSIFLPTGEGEREGRLVALSTDGTRRWSVPVGHQSPKTPAVAAPGTDAATAYADAGREVVAVDVASGSVRSRVGLDGALTAPPVVADGTLYAATADGVRAVSTDDHSERWRSTVELVGVPSSLAVDGGAVYGVTLRGEVVSLAAGDGAERWTTSLDASLVSPPALGRETLYLTAQEGRLIGVSTADGSVGLSRSLGAELLAPPAIHGESAYVCVGDGTLRAFGPAGG